MTENIEEKNSSEVFVNVFFIISVLIISFSGILYLHGKHIQEKFTADNISKIQLSKKIQRLNSSGIDISKDPIQIPYETKEPFIHKAKSKEYKIFPLAVYEISGKVIAKNTTVLFDDKDLGPIDIGLSWGLLAEEEYDKLINFFSVFRLMPCNVNPKMPLNSVYIETHSSHNHIIPADEEILRAAMNLKMKQIVTMRGFLVKVKNEKGKEIWKSSLRRDDHLLNSGGGCEVFYVTEIITEDKT